MDKYLVNSFCDFIYFLLLVRFARDLVVMKNRVLFYLLTIVLTCLLISACNIESKEKAKQLAQRGRLMLDQDMADNGKAVLRFS